MMLRARITRLERQTLPQPGTPDLWVHVRAFDLTQGSRGISEIKVRDGAWYQQPGETEDELKARAAAEAPGPYPRLFVCSFREAVPGAVEASTDV